MVDTRNNSAMFKRAEQLKRWEESDTNRESTLPRGLTERKIKFSLGCVFLAACMAGDKDEVVRLVEMGADIDTANVDGLTALHQVTTILGMTSWIADGWLEGFGSLPWDPDLDDNAVPVDGRLAAMAMRARTRNQNVLFFAFFLV